MLSLAERKRKTILQGELRGLRKKERAARDVGHKRAEPEAPGQRQPRIRDTTYLQWIRRLPCIACMRARVVGSLRIEAAHIRFADAAAGWRNTGMSEKPDDYRTAPLCRLHHQDGPDAQHRQNERQFWEKLNIHPPTLCAALLKAYNEGRDGVLVIQMFASVARDAP